VSKDEYDKKRALVSTQRMHCMYNGMAKGTSRAEVMSNSKNIKPVALAIVNLRKSEGIGQAVSKSVENSVK